MTTMTKQEAIAVYTKSMSEEEIAQMQAVVHKLNGEAGGFGDELLTTAYCLGRTAGAISTLDKLTTFSKQLDEQLPTNVGDKVRAPGRSKGGVAKGRKQRDTGSGNRGRKDKAGD